MEVQCPFCPTVFISHLRIYARINCGHTLCKICHDGRYEKGENIFCPHCFTMVYCDETQYIMFPEIWQKVREDFDRFPDVLETWFRACREFEENNNLTELITVRETMFIHKIQNSGHFDNCIKHIMEFVLLDQMP